MAALAAAGAAALAGVVLPSPAAGEDKPQPAGKPGLFDFAKEGGPEKGNGGSGQPSPAAPAGALVAKPAN